MSEKYDKEIYGTLFMQHKTMPGTERIYTNPDGTKVALRSADRKNNYLDWHILPYEETEKARLKVMETHTAQTKPTHQIPTGSLVTIFNTISTGEVLWSGKLHLEDVENDHLLSRHPDLKNSNWIADTDTKTFNRKQSPLEWASYATSENPATLTKKDGTVLHGRLSKYFEMGIAHDLIVFEEMSDTKSGYDIQHILQTNDHLTVYKTVEDGNIFWQGRVDFNTYAKPVRIPGERSEALNETTRRTLAEEDMKKLHKACLMGYPAKITAPR